MILQIRNLKVYYTNIRAIRGIDFDVYRDETLALIGESSSGKAT